MPHLIVEYSSNLEARLDIQALVAAVHAASLAANAFDIGAVRTRAARREHYAIADQDPDNAFVLVTVRILRGRDEATRRQIGESIFKALCEHLQSEYDRSPLAVSLELQEIDPIAFARNNLPEHIKRRASNQEA